MSDHELRGPVGVPGAGQVADDRPPALGLGRIVMALYWLFGAFVTGTALVDLYSRSGEPLGPLVVALVAGVLYLVAAVALTHNGRRMRVVGWAAITVVTAGPFIIGLAGLGLPEIADVRSPWAHFGATYRYLPLLVGVVGLVWMWWSNPRRIVELAEQVELPTRHH